MSLNDVLLALTTYPTPTESADVTQAIGFAKLLKARVSAIACEARVEVPDRLNIFGSALIDIPGMVAAEAKKSRDNTRHLLEAFETAARNADLFHEAIHEKCPFPQVPTLLVEYARLHDMTLVPLPAVADSDARHYAEMLVFGSGRPVVVLPKATKESPTLSLDTVAVAWDFSRPAARAVADALPILKIAKQVRVLTITDEKALETSRSAPEIAKHLARHGIDVVLDMVPAEGRAIGEVIDSYVAFKDISFLVMGAYGHSRFREFVLGGATESVLAKPKVPVLLSH